ncbi:MAG: 3-hydroxy-3-methylglutaryl CoA synthase, partial [Actinomycetota bacterium]
MTAGATQAGKAAILAIEIYVPRTRIERRTIAEMWGGPAVPGERSLAAADEDAVTMAVQAGSACLRGSDRSLV